MFNRVPAQHEGLRPSGARRLQIGSEGGVVQRQGCNALLKGRLLLEPEAKVYTEFARQLLQAVLQRPRRRDQEVLGQPPKIAINAVTNV